mmetsp:Transcript_122441/g.261248  ORF Transcript_122441/g.261248 Transcript_122441/m.261248 type:complete len:181 (+) Transcript_122441:64-606(+)
MALAPLVVPLALPMVFWGVVAPHGMTDILDAMEKRRMSQLAACYGGTFGAGQALEAANLYGLLLCLGMFLSIWHLRFDFGGLRGSTLIHFLLALVGLIDVRIAFTVMTILLAVAHVPGHYRRHAHLIAEKPLESAALLTSSTAVGLMQCPMTEVEFTAPLLSVTVAHILFTECGPAVEEP